MIRDPAYPILGWLIKGYSGSLSPQQESFNAYLNSARIVIENSIGKLKSRWRCLKKTVEMDYTFVPKVNIFLLPYTYIEEELVSSVSS